MAAIEKDFAELKGNETFFLHSYVSIVNVLHNKLSLYKISKCLLTNQSKIQLATMLFNVFVYANVSHFLRCGHLPRLHIATPFDKLLSWLPRSHPNLLSSGLSDPPTHYFSVVNRWYFFPLSIYSILSASAQSSQHGTPCTPHIIRLLRNLLWDIAHHHSFITPINT